MKFTHLDAKGNATMVDISEKQSNNREAIAKAILSTTKEVLDKIYNLEIKKGDVLATARIAGIMAAKQTSSLIPLCHQLNLSKVAIDFERLNDTQLQIVCFVKTNSQTGVEMEALTGASLAALTFYDMCKALDKSISYEVFLSSKIGGKSGVYQR